MLVLSARRKACLFAAVVGAALGFLPLFGGPGYEIALAYGVLLPSAAAIAAAMGPQRETPTRGLWDGLVSAAAVYAAALSVSFLHLLHAPSCEPLEGAGYMLLSSGVGTLLGGLWGACVREFAREAIRRRTLLRVLAALAAPLGCIVVSVQRFYATPAIFAYDPFAGYFSGTLYDTVVEPGAALWLYRAGSACTLLGTLLVSLGLRRDRARPGSLPRLHVRDQAPAVRALVGVGAALLAVNVGLWLYADRFDFSHDARSIARGLGGRLDGPRCSVVFPKTLEDLEAALLLRDCEEELADVERVLGARGPERVTAFFFRDSAEKKRYMGAASTYIAKPWRHEVYLQIAGYPHPVLGHELAHVVAGAFGRGPFRIGGSLYGLLPNPGLIEGIATAASPDDDALTDLQWCKAMKDENLLPAIPALFSLSFLGQSSSRAYTVAGAFVEYVRVEYGAGVVRSWYAGGELPTLTGRSWQALEAEFRAQLDTLQLSTSARAYARAKFGKPGVFGRRCPHVLDRLRGQGEACVRDHDFEEAQRAFDAALQLDPSDARTKLALAGLAFARGDAGAARARYETLIGDPSAQVRERARDQLGDMLLLLGDYAAAANAFEAIARETENEDLARNVEVKLLAANDPTLRAALVTLLAGLPPSGARSPLLAGVLLGQAHSTTARAAALSSYLIGKNLMNQGAYATALPWLQSAFREQDQLGDRVRRELYRQLAIAACVTGARDVLRTVSRELEGMEVSGRTTSIARLVRRCEPPTQ